MLENGSSRGLRERRDFVGLERTTETIVRSHIPNAKAFVRPKDAA